MSIPPSQAAPQSPVQYPLQYEPPRQVQFGWIGESWQLFSAQLGTWVLATLALIGPTVLVIIVFYAYFFWAMFPNGFPPPAPPPYTPGSPPPAPVSPFFTNPANTFEILAVEVVAVLLLGLWAAFVGGGVLRMAISQVRGLPISTADIFAGGPVFGRLFGASLLLGLAFYGLEAICLGPGALIAAQHFSAAATISAFLVGGLALLCLAAVISGLLLPAYALMADGESLFVAIRRSVKAMKVQWLPAAGFIIVLGLLVYISELPCGLGLLATLPMFYLCCALAYRDLVGMPNMNFPAPGYPPTYPPSTPGVWPPPPGAGPSLQ